MKEYFEKRSFAGEINVACKFENQPTRYWTTDKASVIGQIIRIVNRHIKEGETLTLRQLHYQFVGHVPGYVNHTSAYKKLGNILDDLRYSGIMPWDAFEDRGRRPFIPYSVKDIPDALRDTVDQYRIDRQEGQSVYIELWTEKDALSAIFSKITSHYHINLVVNKGYTSSAAAHQAYLRFAKNIEQGRRVVILYFGDHDPSGLDMVRDIQDRITFFLTRGRRLRGAAKEFWDEYNSDCFFLCDYYDNGPLAFRLLDEKKPPSEKDIEDWNCLISRFYIEQTSFFKINHIGLTMEQIEKFNLPENPTKLTDTRAKDYIKKFGKKCWEVDAIDVTELRKIVRFEIESIIDMKKFNRVMKREKSEIKELETMIKQMKK